MIDIEKLVSGYLRSDAGVAAIVDRRVVASPPRSTDLPWVRLWMLDDRAVGDDRHDHLVDYMLQLDCYAGADEVNGAERPLSGHPEAVQLGLAVRAALRDMPGVHDDGVVTGVRFLRGFRDPDPDVDESARERVVRRVSVYAHA